jgi:1-acyl-sn-glycerol-3-phosphate acyltransferase
MPRRRVSGDDRGFKWVYWWLNASYCAFWHRLRYRFREDDPLPPEGPAILISNHTCCIDHVLLQASTRRVLGFVIAKELYEYWLFKPFCSLAGCIPVRRDGRDLSATRAALRALDEGRVVPIFPEGTILPTSGRELGEGKPGVAYLALTSRAPVIPAYICGTPETNKVVPSYLTPSHARVTFGPPVDLSEFYTDGKVDRDRLDEATDRLMAAIRALRDQVQGDHDRPGAPAAAAGASGGSANGQRPDGRARELSGGRAAAGRP